VAGGASCRKLLSVFGAAPVTIIPIVLSSKFQTSFAKDAFSL
jgi:hypothetical protein